MKVQHRPEVFTPIKAVKKYLQDYSQERHTLIHKHSLVDAKMRRIEVLYLRDLDVLGEDETWVEEVKAYRARVLKAFIAEKKLSLKKLTLGWPNGLIVCSRR